MRLFVHRQSLHCLLLLALVMLAACGEQETASHPLTCHIAYRSSVSVAIEREDVLALTQLTPTPRMLTYTELAFHAQYFDDQGFSPTLNLYVTLPDHTERLMSVLYQLPHAAAPTNQFAGGHGFTGLHYVYHPVSGAELQFWCVAG